MMGHIKAMGERISCASPLAATFPILRSNPLKQTFKRLIIQLVNQLQFERNGTIVKPINISDDAIYLWMDYMMNIVSYATGGIALQIGTKVKENNLFWTQRFVEALDSFTHTHLCNIRQPDMWITNDIETDLEDSDDGDNTSFEYGSEEESDENYDSSEDEEEDSDGAYNSDEEYDDTDKKTRERRESDDLNCDVGEPLVCKIPIVGRKPTAKKQNKKDEGEAGSAPKEGKKKINRKSANEKLITANKHFLYVEKSGKISRAQCVLCISSTSTEILSLSNTCAVICCRHCICALNVLSEEEAQKRRGELIRRVENRYKVPLGFRVGKPSIGNVAQRIWINKMKEMVSAKDKTPSTYNRLSPNFKKRMATGLAKRAKKDPNRRSAEEEEDCIV